MGKGTVNCRFCDKMSDWQFSDDHNMDAFVCAHWEAKHKKQQNPVWVYPEMEFSCEFFIRADTDTENVRKMEEKMFLLQKENEALQKELEKFVD